MSNHHENLGFYFFSEERATGEIQTQAFSVKEKLNAIWQYTASTSTRAPHG